MEWIRKLGNIMSQNAVQHPGGCLCEEGYFTTTEFHSPWTFAFMLIILVLTPMFIRLLWNNGVKFETCYRRYRNKGNFITTMIILTPLFLIASWFFSFIVVWGALGLLIFQTVHFFTSGKHREFNNWMKSKLEPKEPKDSIKQYKQELLSNFK